MRNFIAAALSVGLLTIGASAAGAMPIANTASNTEAGITLVAGGCGPGFHPGRFGNCRPNGGFGYGRPGFVRPGFGPRYGRPGFGRPGFGRPGFAPRPYGNRF